MDQVWGNIRTFYPQDVLFKFDILNSSRCCINGQCTLLRNVPSVNSLFWEIPGIRDLLKNEVYHGMDERGLNDLLCLKEKQNCIRVLRRRLQTTERWSDWDDWSNRVEIEENGSLKNFPPLTGGCEWRDGRVFHRESGTEMAFYHFHFAKKLYTRQAWKYVFWPDSMDGWVMDLRGLRMIFKQGHFFARIKYYFLTQAGRTPWHWANHPLRNLMDLVKERMPALIPVYQKFLALTQRKSAY
jgi:hypothetical protein